MKAVLLALLASLRSGFRSRTALQFEVLALRHQLAVYQRCPPRPRIKVADRLLWAWLSRTWAGWRNALVFVQPSTVIAWQRRSVRRECLDQVIVLDERHLRRLLGDYFQHYHRWRCHRSLAMDCLEPRPVQGPERGHVVEVAEAGGLYRHYERRAA